MWISSCATGTGRRSAVCPPVIRSAPARSDSTVIAVDSIATGRMWKPARRPVARRARVTSSKSSVLKTKGMGGATAARRAKKEIVDPALQQHMEQRFGHDFLIEVRDPNR